MRLSYFFYLVRLVCWDIQYELLLSLCMVCALGAIFAPIIILLGLQKGIIGNMFEKLESDPLSCLVVPQSSTQSPLADQHLEEIRKHASVLIVSPVSHLLLDIQGVNDPINVLPTAANDPLLIRSGIRLSDSPKEIVLSFALAKKLEQKRGGKTIIKMVRYSPAKETVDLELDIAGVLGDDGFKELKAWLPVELFTSIYGWRKGSGAPELNLKGVHQQEVGPEYDGAITLFEKRFPSQEEYRIMLARQMPFSSIPITIQDSSYGFKIDLEKKIFLWKTINSTITDSDLQMVRYRHNELGYDPEIIPYISDLRVRIEVSGDTRDYHVAILPEELDGGYFADGMVLVRLPTGIGHGGEEKSSGLLSYLAGLDKKVVTLPVVVEKSSDVVNGFVALDKKSAGLLRSAKRQGAEYDQENHVFVLPHSESLRYFRAYAPTIYKLDELVEAVSLTGKKLQSSALESPKSRLPEVKKIRLLSCYLEKLYILIVAISSVSTIFAVIANVYAGVQRRRYDLAYLCMLGVPNSIVHLFPLLKSLILIGGGIMVALLAYHSFGWLAVYWFADLLSENHTITRLPLQFLGAMSAFILLLGGVASSVAVIHVTKREIRKAMNG